MENATTFSDKYLSMYPCPCANPFTVLVASISASCRTPMQAEQPISEGDDIPAFIYLCI